MGSGDTTIGSGFGINFLESNAANKITANVWNHVAVVLQGVGSAAPWTPSTVTFYHNGVSRASIPWAGGSRQLGLNDMPYQIGRYYTHDLGLQFFSGQVDELRIWKVARSA